MLSSAATIFGISIVGASGKVSPAGELKRNGWTGLSSMGFRFLLVPFLGLETFGLSASFVWEKFWTSSSSKPSAKDTALFFFGVVTMLPPFPFLSSSPFVALRVCLAFRASSVRSR